MILSSEDTSVKKLLTPKKGDVDLLNSYENLVMCMVPCNCLCWNVCGFQIEEALSDLFSESENKLVLGEIIYSDHQ